MDEITAAPDLRTGNPTASVAPDRHTHTPDGAREAEIVEHLLTTLHLSCGSVGAHSHPLTGEDGRITNRLHHHHDLRCLVTSGERVGEGERKRLQDRLDAALWRERHFRDKVVMTRAELVRVQDLVTRAMTERRLMDEFLDTMPAVGPWKTLREQWDSWLEEQTDPKHQEVGHQPEREEE